MDPQCLHHPSLADSRKCLDLPRRNVAFNLLEVSGLRMDGRTATRRANLQVPDCPAIDSYLEEIRNSPGIVGLSNTLAYRLMQAEKPQNATIKRRQIQIAVRGNGFYQHVPILKSEHSACFTLLDALREQNRHKLTRSKTETWHIPQSPATNRCQSSVLRLSPIGSCHSSLVRPSPTDPRHSPNDSWQYSSVRPNDIGQPSLSKAYQHQQLVSSPSFNPHPFDDSSLKVTSTVSRTSHSKRRQRKSCLRLESLTKNFTFPSSGLPVPQSLLVNQTSSGKTKRKKRKRLRKRKKSRATSWPTTAPTDLQKNNLTGMVPPSLGLRPVSSTGETRYHWVHPPTANRNMAQAQQCSSDLPSQPSSWTSQPLTSTLCRVADCKRGKQLRRLRITGQALGAFEEDNNLWGNQLINLDTVKTAQLS